ncbi:hypothetical protein GQX73_g2768 [Xylaria multiplex]|uniref:Uncharacterized protein n=1 Tax=Xylaria multiplex TaxID=323545 RepID=A0A7C8ITR5_9PEZI|nr:hypothetical protein GQX73_g2768 [Xylaria multiplex]
MDLITIRQSFNHSLPSYDAQLQGLVPTHMSGSSTLATDPPNFCVEIQHQVWVKCGLDELGKVSRGIDGEYISRRENAMAHYTEGDVARSAAIYLLHPVNQVLSAIPRFAGIECLSEQTVNGVRSDITFNYPLGSRDKEYRCFAVVEFKKRGAIIEKEFRDAIRTIPLGDQSIHAHTAAAVDEEGNSFLQGNAVKMMKQTASYAKKHKTRYVALFNWDYLVLVRFVMFDPRNTKNGVGEYCEVTIVRNVGTESSKIRAALLGFLLEAHNAS